VAAVWRQPPHRSQLARLLPHPSGGIRSPDRFRRGQHRRTAGRIAHAGTRWPLRVPGADQLRGGHLGLARTAGTTFTRHNRATHEQLAAPDTPRFAALKRAGQTGGPGPAAPAYGFRLLDTLRRLGEEGLRVPYTGKVKSHRQRKPGPRRRRRLILNSRLADGGIAPLHRYHPLSLPRRRPRWGTLAERRPRPLGQQPSPSDPAHQHDKETDGLSSISKMALFGHTKFSGKGLRGRAGADVGDRHQIRLLRSQCGSPIAIRRRGAKNAGLSTRPAPTRARPHRRRSDRG